MNRTRPLLVALLLMMASTPVNALPNIVLLTADDMNCDSVGAFGCVTPETTPNIDALAADSCRFKHAHVHASSCVPSRNIVMTGRYLYNSGVEGFYAVPPSVKPNPTIPEFLKANGYYVMIRGKETHSTPYYPFPVWDINFKDGHIMGNHRHPESFYQSTSEGVQAARQAGRPFFFNINIYDPHAALYSWRTKTGTAGLNRLDVDNHPSRVYKPDEIDVPGFLPDTPLVRREVAAYYSTVRRADDSVGRIIAALKDAGGYEDTIIIFFSDHGMPFPFAKTAMYYHSTHTPLAVRWPGVTRVGSVDDHHVVGTVDLFPTIAEMVNVEPPEGLDGRSLGELLRGGTQDDREFVYTMYEENVGGKRQPTRTVVSKDYGYIVNLWSDSKRRFATATRGMASTREITRLADEGDKTMQKRLNTFNHRVLEEFYHYAEDPDALVNLIGDPTQAERIEAFRRQARTFMKLTNDPTLEAFENRYDESAIQAYLNQLDAAVKIRKADPVTYKRNFNPNQPPKARRPKPSMGDERMQQRRERRKPRKQGRVAADAA